MPTTNSNKLVRRTRIYMVIVALAILVASGWLYLYMKQTAVERAAQNKHTFAEYVSTRHLGTLSLIDTGTGIDPMAYVLTLNNNVADAERVPFAENLAHLYAEYDHGSALIIAYVDPVTHKQRVIAESHYDDDHQQLQLTVNLSSGQTQQVNQHVDW